MPKSNLTRLLMLPELKLLSHRQIDSYKFEAELIKESVFEVCPKCATPSSSIYDHVYVHIQDAPLRKAQVFLKIKKRRFFCNVCRNVFTEPVRGIRKGHRTTERFRHHIMWCADHFSNLSDVRRQLGVSSWLIYKAYYEQLNLELKKLKNPWATTIGIDEHSFIRNKRRGYRDFATIFVEYNHKRVRELVLGRSPSELLADQRLTSIPGRENVKNVIIDLSKNYRNLAKELFPNAKITADKFHVIRLFNNILNNYRKLATGDKRKNPIRKLLLKKSCDLWPHVKYALSRWLEENQKVKEVYEFKEAIHRFYKIKGCSFAKKILIRLTDKMSLSSIPEIQSLRKTLCQWREEIVQFFENGLTNGRTEGFNRKAKLIQRNAYGFKSFENYRRRLIYNTS